VTREIRLNAFEMNRGTDQSPGLWRHPRDRAWQYGPDLLEIVLTKKGKYGHKSMVRLAGLEPGAIAQVAETNSISKNFLGHMLTELGHAGLVYFKKGRGGDYALARPANNTKGSAA
jgi:hypothetical protein